jgi:hypothetical protein
MTKQAKVLLAVVVTAIAGYAALEYYNKHPESAALPGWISGEFAASAERYAGRTVAVDTAAIRFSRGDGTVDVLPIRWIEEIPDARAHIRMLNLHVKDGDAESIIKLIASSEDSSFRLQTMPDVAWRKPSDREARLARSAAQDTATSSAPVVATIRRTPSVISSEPSDTTIGATRFADSDPVAKDELKQVVKACRVYGCRIGIQGLHANRYDEFAIYLRGLGADSVSLSTETVTGTTLAMLEIPPKRSPARTPSY